MQQLKIFIELTRLNKPIGFMLLFWPCSWGLAYAFKYNQNLELFIYYLVLFFLGSVLMRSAGCIINDIVDRNLDKKVKRTKNRPLASGKISLLEAAYYSIFLCGTELVQNKSNLYSCLLSAYSIPLLFHYHYKSARKFDLP